MVLGVHGEILSAVTAMASLMTEARDELDVLGRAD